MHIHILGICGTFMGGVAAIAQQAGHTVTGCDNHVYPPMSTQLESLGIRLTQGYGTEQLDLAPDIWVVGNVVARGRQPLMEAILDRGLPYTSGPQWLAEQVLRHKWVLAVAGTHGKTTTASMLAWILEDCGLDPGYLIGGVPLNFGVSARLTGASFFVIEADEYDTAFFDKRSKFVHYRPRTLVMNNLEYDHADIFPDLAAIETQFHHLVRTVPGNGLVISQGGDASLERVLERGCWTPVERFDLAGGWRAEPLAGSASRFDVWLGDAALGRVEWDLLGEHNRRNALAAIAAARHAGVPPRDAIAALARFQNVKRRMEVRGGAHGITIYDDFAHHPTAIASTIAGLRAQVGAQRILAVLELRSNTMKLGVMKAQLPASLAGADRVYCYSGGIAWDVAAALAPLGDKAGTYADLSALVEAIAREGRAGDHVLIMSNGGFGDIHAKLLTRLRDPAAGPARARRHA
ncbi:MAG TPA: UDP-N-acetylmuramate:L-alanyl-gamma-D-glutamyl-meso-diaminopimelate ligase [Thiobacillaceae bacterium]|nr:UDP-N-acetylmuramate:L-alanyl-gamma-D-glutamyl-meso-diaminopimelate ligase [Thiobacillaceae bacterium]HNU63851.1 UDP-N-acetylmuramate:L-alanyl-gamma-D-glutamyl-meso-diaminopimelate ligase [Thiobacillaceae bacterium]